MLRKEKYCNIEMFVINTDQAADQVSLLCKTQALPVLQDTPEEFVWGLYSANKDYTFIIDKNGYIAKFWEWIDFNTQKAEVKQAMKDVYGQADEEPCPQ